MQIRWSALSGTAALAVAMMGGLAMNAAAQAPPAPAASLAAQIERESDCNAANTVGEVRRRLLLASGLSASEIGRALALVSASPTACEPIKAAAMTLAEAYPQPGSAPQVVAAEPAQATPPAASDAVKASEAAGADLKFVVGAPPRRLTKGRNAGS